LLRPRDDPRGRAPAAPRATAGDRRRVQHRDGAAVRRLPLASPEPSPLEQPARGLLDDVARDGGGPAALAASCLRPGLALAARPLGGGDAGGGRGRAAEPRGPGGGAPPEVRPAGAAARVGRRRAARGTRVSGPRLL